ncbi:MAG: hypothetical protein ACKVUT_00105 [Gaiella sp.]
MGRKRRDEAGSAEDERTLLREQRHELERMKLQLVDRIGAVEEREQELRAVLRDARNGKPVDGFALSLGTDRDAILLARNAEIDRRERELADRERALADREAVLERRPVAPSAVDDAALAALRRELEEREAALSRREAELGTPVDAATVVLPPVVADPSEERLAEIEAKLKELKEAEKQFGRTQRELAARSEALAARERLIAQREKELAAQEDQAWGAFGSTELESRLTRLERQQASASAVTQDLGFAGGLRKLAEQGTRPAGTGG